MAGDGDSELVSDIEKYLNKNTPPPTELPETATLQDARDNLDVLYRYVRDQVMSDPSTIHLDENSTERRFDGPRATEYRRVVLTDAGEVRVQSYLFCLLVAYRDS
jgi:hypothetical protein